MCHCGRSLINLVLWAFESCTSNFESCTSQRKLNGQKCLNSSSFFYLLPIVTCVNPSLQPLIPSNMPPTIAPLHHTPPIITKTINQNNTTTSYTTTANMWSRLVIPFNIFNFVDFLLGSIMKVTSRMTSILCLFKDKISVLPSWFHFSFILIGPRES